MSLPALSLKTINGELEPLAKYAGKVLLIVNVASKCGFTNQYSGLQKLHEEFYEDGLAILGFPCNQFGQQEPGNEAEIKGFCEMNYGVTFPMFSKIDVNGPETDPLFQWLKKSRSGLFGIDAIKWNFTKFLVGRDGEVLRRYAPTSSPEGLRDDIKDALS